MIVLKFGGTSVQNAERVRESARIAAAQPSPRVVVVSAASGVTNLLLEAARGAGDGSARTMNRAVERIHAIHAEIIDGLSNPREQSAARTSIDTLHGQLDAVLAEVAAAGELSSRHSDRVVSFGEKSMSVLMAATLRDRGTAAAHVFADTVVGTDDRFGSARLDRARTRANAQALIRPLCAEGKTVVVTGFIGHAPDGSTTTLGRGGSDYSATILGAALDADEVQIWTDVPGVLSADPRKVAGARVVPQISYDEAQELAHFGAKVLHPRTIRPAVARDIPVRILSTYAATEPGTVVTREPLGGGIKAVTALSGLLLLTIDVQEIEDLAGAAAGVFGTLHADGAEVAFAAQASSRRRMTYLVDEVTGGCERLKARIQSVVEEFEAEVNCTDNVALIAVVGAGAAGHPATVSRMLKTLEREGIPVLAMNQQDANVALVAAVPEPLAQQATLTLHRELVESSLPTTPPARRRRRASLLDEPIRVG
ncbi:MAG TPA: aspartate kinase [Thermomicrobiales bacterium]|jgi:aspartate kinase|nr:aspartate kinase [Thermomicrobiales bacterium]